MLRLQMEPACFSVRKNVQDLELLAVTAACSVVHVMAPSVLELAGQPWCLQHSHHMSVSLSLCPFGRPRLEYLTSGTGGQGRAEQEGKAARRRLMRSCLQHI